MSENNEKINNAPQNNGGEGNRHHSKNRNRNRRRFHSKNKKKNQNNAPEQNGELLAVEPEENQTAPEAAEEYTPAEEDIVEESTPYVSPKKSEVMVEVVGVHFKSSDKTYYFDPAGITAKKGDFAIVDTARGLEYGEICLANTSVSEDDIVPPLRKVIRIATEADRVHNAENKKKEKEAFSLCCERIAAHELDMKLIDAQYTFDNSKLLFYFSSAGRVDFRDLVKDLASVFRTRIELRQIGIRDEAKLIGGLGLCGRPLCCSVFLNNFGQVSIKMAKEQNLSLNSSKISGICGRLMCCLHFEHETYEYEIKRTPPVDSVVKTSDGIGTVCEISPLTGMIKVRLHDKPDTPPKPYHRDAVTLISKKQKNENPQ